MTPKITADANFITGSDGLIAVDKIGNKILFLDPVSYETMLTLNGFAPRVHELELAAEQVEDALQRRVGRQDRQPEVPQPEERDHRAYGVEGGRTQAQRRRRIAAHDQLLRDDDLRQAIDDLSGRSDRTGGTCQREGDGDGHQDSVEGAHCGSA